MAKLVLETDRLQLKRLDYRDSVFVLDYFTRNKEFLKVWEATKPCEFYTIPYIERMLNSEAMLYCDGRLVKFYIFKKDDDSKVIGTVALNEIVRGCFQSCFLGYRLDENEINKGYMTEAINAVVDYGFNHLKLHRIEANIMPRNGASLRAVSKSGFYHEGISKSYLLINGRWEDHVHMVKLNDDYIIE